MPCRAEDRAAFALWYNVLHTHPGRGKCGRTSRRGEVLPHGPGTNPPPRTAVADDKGVVNNLDRIVW